MIYNTNGNITCRSVRRTGVSNQSTGVTLHLTSSQELATAKLRSAISAFQPFNEQEQADKQVILQALNSDPNCFDRGAQAHMACSIWVVSPVFLYQRDNGIVYRLCDPVIVNFPFNA